MCLTDWSSTKEIIKEYQRSPLNILLGFNKLLGDKVDNTDLFLNGIYLKYSRLLHFWDKAIHNRLKTKWTTAYVCI